MAKSKILLQLDSDVQPSSFDAVVAVDAGVEQLFSHSSVTSDQVRGLVHGCMFTRGPDELNNTAIFVGGSDVEKVVANFHEVVHSFFGSIRCSVMLDGNGCNTTAAAAVLAAANHVDLAQTTALVLGATGPVGQRVARLLAGQGAQVRLGSRSLARAGDACKAIGEQAKLPGGRLRPFVAGTGKELDTALKDTQLVISAGAAGVLTLPQSNRSKAKDLLVAIDLNAVPPVGIEGVEVMAKAEPQSSVLVYGAIGVGGMKMKIHKAALRSLFDAKDAVLDAEEILAIGQELG